MRPRLIVRRPPYNWSQWTILMAFANIADGLIGLVTLGFIDAGFGPWCAEKHLRHAAAYRRSLNERT